MTATVYYPRYNPTWTEEVRQNYGGNIIWKGIPEPTITLSPSVVKMFPGESQTITVSNLIAGDAVESWESKDTSIAIVDASGNITALSAGRTKVTVTLLSGLKGIVTVAVTRKDAVQFNDVTDSSLFYYEPVCWAVDSNITTGYDDNTFRPNNNCNRAAVVTFLWKMARKPDKGITKAFSDMTGNSDFDHAISWAAEQGITTGYADGTFRPWATCHRAAIVTFLWRYAGKPEPSKTASFTDLTKNSDFDKAISWAAEKGITTGYNDNTFRPWNQCLRLAIVSFLYRYADL